MDALLPGNDDASAERPLSVAELSAQIKDALETAFPSVWVVGEVSNIARPQSGHIYLTLKDETAQLRAVMWRNTAARLRFDLDDGQEVVCRGSIDVYPPRGGYQLIIRDIEPRGLGALQLAFRQLHRRLAAEGLFDPEHKQPLPPFPQRIALVTSPTGAAVRDFLEVVRRRWGGVHVIVIPARVQGDGAAEEIARGIETANRLQPAIDVLVVGRGGGSLEDLWCFNEERVVRAVFASTVPIVSAVGHEIDVTLSDLAADVRAATPTEAAERVVPSLDELQAGLKTAQKRLAAALRAVAGDARARLEALAKRRVLRSPFDLVHDLSRRVDELQVRALRAVRRRVEQASEQRAALAARLESLNPRSVLSRGYSITQRADGSLLRDAREVAAGDKLVTTLAKGEVASRVESTRTERM